MCWHLEEYLCVNFSLEEYCRRKKNDWEGPGPQHSYHNVICYLTWVIGTLKEVDGLFNTPVQSFDLMFVRSATAKVGVKSTAWVVLTSVAAWGLGGWEFRGSSVVLKGKVLASMGAAPVVLPEGFSIVLPVDFFKAHPLNLFSFYLLFEYNPKKNQQRKNSVWSLYPFWNP